MSPQEIVGIALKGSIMLTVFGLGLEANIGDLLYLIRRPRLLFLSIVAMFVAMPLFAILLTRLFTFQPSVVIALIALSISPIPPLLPKKVTKSGGLVPYGLGLMFFAGLFAIVYIPAATYLIGRYADRPFGMAPFAVAKLVALSVLVPLLLGTLVRRLAPGIAKRIANPITRVAGIVLLLGVLCILAVTFRTAWSLVGDGTLAALAIFVIVGLVVGHLLGGPSPDERVTLALSTAARHPGLALAIAGANAPHEPRVIGAVLLYLLLNAVLTIPYVSWQRKKAQQFVAGSPVS